MKHIAIISTSFPSANDGSEAAGSFVADFAIELSSHIQVTVIAPSLTSYEERISPSLSIKRFQVPHLPLSVLKPSKPKDWLAIINTLNAGKFAIEQLVRETTVDYIFAFWALPSGYWAKIIGKTYNIPYFTWSLGSDIWSLGKIPIIKNVLKSVLKASHSNFADGYLLKEAVEKISGKQCFFLPSTRSLNVTEKKLLAEKSPYRLAFLGRWHPNKGIDILLESFTKLSHSDWENIEEVKICGGGGLEKEITLACDNLKAQGHPITQCGYLTKEEATKLFIWADYILIPSRIESIPVVFSDAMKCSSPVICMPVGDLYRLLEEYEVGVLAKEVSVIAFANAISMAIQNSPKQYKNDLKQAEQVFSLSHSVNLFLENSISQVRKEHAK